MREPDQLEITVTFLFGVRCLYWRPLEDALDEIEQVVGPAPPAVGPVRVQVERLIEEGAMDLDRGGILTRLGLGRLGLTDRPPRIRLNPRAAEYLESGRFQRMREDILTGRYRPPEEMPATSGTDNRQ